MGLIVVREKFTNKNDYLEEVTVELGGDSPGQQGLASTGRAIEEAAFRGRDTHSLEQLGVQQGEFNDLQN